MNDRFKFRIGFTVSYYDDDGNDKTTQLKISEDFSVICGGSDVRIHNDIIEEAIDELNPTDHERTTIIDYIETNYCCNDGFWLIDNIDYLDQCTGLKDKNGILVYEGDILAVPYVDPIFMQPVNMEINNTIAYVESYKGCFVAHYPERQMKYLYYYENTAEVIGNIHESKELLDDE